MKNCQLLLILIFAISCSSDSIYYQGKKLNTSKEDYFKGDSLAAISNNFSIKYGNPILRILVGQTNTSIIQVLQIDYSNDSVFSNLFYYLPNRDITLPKVFKIDKYKTINNNRLLDEINAIQLMAKRTKESSSNQIMDAAFYRIEFSEKSMLSKNLWIKEGIISDNDPLAKNVYLLFTELKFKPIFRFNEDDFYSLLISHLPERLDSLQKELSNHSKD
jgi:hypothetical protein